MRKIILILFIGYISSFYAQNTIEGNITDEKNVPVFGVQIYIEQLHTGTTSDENGHYKISSIPNGTHQLFFNYLGYEIKTIEVTLSDQEKELNITLTEAVFHMDEIIVSAPFHKAQNENVMKVVSKSIASLKKEGGISLIESLTNIPGVEEISTGTGIGKPVIRGLSGNRVLVYTQGVRLENQQYGDEHGLGVNEAGIESVEVIKGPASLLYGSDALGGVVYLNPEKFALPKTKSLEINQKFYSNTLGSNTSFGVKNSGNKLKFLGRVTYNTHADYKIPNGKRVTNTRFNEGDLKLGVGLNTEKYVSEIRYNLNVSEIGITEGVDIQSKNRTPNLPYQDIKNQIFSFHNHFFLNNSRLDLDLGYIDNHRKEFEDHEHQENPNEPESNEDAPINMKLATLSYSLKYEFPKTDKFESIVGIQGMNQNNSNFGEEILIPNATTNDIGLFVTSLFSWKEVNQFQAGLRLDHRDLTSESYMIEDGDLPHEIEALDLTFQNLTFSLGNKFLIKKVVTTRINFASGFRAPNLGELSSFGIHHGTNRFEIGNPDLKSEQNFQLDLSLEYQSKHFELFLNGFYNKIKNYIFLEPTLQVIEGFEVYKFVQNNSKLYGGEIGFHLHPHPMDWLHIESNFETVTGIQDNGDYLPLIPSNKLTNSIRTEFNINKKMMDSYFSVSLKSYFKKTNVNSLEQQTNGYNLLNFSLGTNFDFGKSDLQIQINLNNALNETYISHLSRLKIYGVPNIGRNLMLGINFKL